MPRKKLKAKVSKLQQLKDTWHTSTQILKLAWSISPFLFLGNVITFAVPSILPFVNIYIYKLIIDFVVRSVTRHQTDLRPIFYLLVLRLLSSYLQVLAAKLQDYFENLLWLKLPIRLSELILGKLSQLDIRYFEDSQFRDLLENIDETYRFQTLNLVSFLLYTMQSLIQLVIASVAIASVSWILIIIIIVAAAAEFIYQIIKVDVQWNLWWTDSPARTKFKYLSRLLQDTAAIKEIKIFQLGQHFLEEIISLQEKFYDETKKLAQKSLAINAGMGFISTVVSGGAEIYIIAQAIIGRLTIGDISFYSGVIVNFQNGLGGLLRNLGSVFESSLYVKSIFELLEAEPFLPTAENPVVFRATMAPKIEFVNVSFTYPGATTPTLHNFSLTIQPGEKIAFVGENGAGKSTIIKLLARFYDVTEGKILINDIDLRELDLASWHQHIGVLFQDFNRYQHTARENIYFGNLLADATTEKVSEAAQSAGAEAVIHKLEHQYDQVLGKTFEEGVELSTGQWQKVALARSFFRNAPVLILDEPTAAIDAKAEAEIFDSVEKLSKEKTVIIISHRFSTVRNADKVYVIENGRIAESGSHDELMKKKGTYEELFTLQARGYR